MYRLLLAQFLYSFCIVAAVFSYTEVSAQTVIGGDTIDQSAILDLQDTARGMLLSRLTTTQRNAIVQPAFGLLILNTTKKCLETNIGSPDMPTWKCLTTGIPVLSDADTMYWNSKLGAGDTAALSHRINTKLNSADTTAMLSSFLKKFDTLSLSNRIDDKLGLPPSGNNLGNILYWNGTSWVRLNPGLPGQLISLSPEGIPVWTGAALASLTTNNATSITPTAAILSGNISADGGANISARGIVWSTTTNPTLSASVLNLGSGTGSFTGTLSGLSPNTTYHIRAFATNSAGTAYGNQVNFQTSPVSLPTLITTDASGITQTAATSGGTITNNGGTSISSRGLVYGTSPNPTLSNSVLNIGSGEGSFSGTITGLQPNTTYYVRAFGINSAGTGYGNNLSFQTSIPATPSLTTREIINISNATATGGGSITNDGGSSIVAKGICWSTSPNPTIANNKIGDGTGTATFTSFLTGLAAATTYYVRAYATNATGTGYGNQQTFTTSLTSNTLAVVFSQSVTGLTTIHATLNAEVTSQGGGTVTERGAVWNTNGNPTVNSNRVVSGSGTGTFSVNLTGLSGGRNYFVRAYAINNYGISYGVEIPFSTLTGLATLNTNSVIAQSTTANSGGNIIDDGGSNIIARGVVWNTAGTPTLANNKTIDGTGIGSFVSNITDLSQITTYYLRAYATNEFGTAYGDERTFSTTTLSLPVADIDGNTYQTVQIGTQIWMSENLKTSRYQNGDAIPYIVDNTTWSQLNTGAWCYNNHDAANNSLYGKLYNWYTISDLRGVCPVGWHIPTELEWNILNEYLGGNGTAPKLKSREGWRNSNATGESGFNALPSGFRDSRSGTFDHWGLSISNQVFCIFWANQNSYPGIRYIYGDYPNLNRNRDGSDALGYFAIGEERTGGSIRCIKN